MQMLMVAFGALRRWALQLGPMALIEIVLPGGTLIVTLLWLYRRWRAGATATGGRHFPALEAAPIRASAADVHNARFRGRR